MRKITALVLLLCMILGMTACGADMESADYGGTEYYTFIEEESLFPLGTSGIVEDAALSGDELYVCGNAADGARLMRIKYRQYEASFEFDAAEAIDLTLGKNTRAIAVSADDAYIYLLAAELLPDSDEIGAYFALVLSATGELAARIDIDFPTDDTPLGITAVDGHRFWVRGLHNLAAYTADGALIGTAEDYRADICCPIIVDGQMYVQLADYSSGELPVYLADTETGALSKADTLPPLERNFSKTQSSDASGVINDGDYLYRVDADGQCSVILDWYNTVHDYGAGYRAVCRLSDEAYILVPDASAELVYITVREKEDDRIPLTLAFYGSATEDIDGVFARYARYMPNYRLSYVNYGWDDAGLNKLLTDLSAGADIDVVICDGQINPYSAFVDLYPLIDADAELTREAFVPQILSGIEHHGQLNAIWGAFTVDTLQAMGILAQGDAPLRLAECPQRLADAEYDGAIFDCFYTKERIANYLIPALLSTSYDAESGRYMLNNPDAAAMVRICDYCPLEFSFEDAGEDISFSEVLQWKSLGGVDTVWQLDANRDSGYRYFDGSDGGDNLSMLCCSSRSCYMIPKGCTDVDAAWGFVRKLLTEQWQLKYFTDNKVGLPCNIRALDCVLSSETSSASSEQIHYMLENSPVRNYATITLADIIISSLRAYFTGASTLEVALDAAQSRVNIYFAEQA